MARPLPSSPMTAVFIRLTKLTPASKSLSSQKVLCLSPSKAMYVLSRSRNLDHEDGPIVKSIVVTSSDGDVDVETATVVLTITDGDIPTIESVPSVLSV